MGDGERRLWDLLEPWLEAEGVEIDDLELLGIGAGRLVASPWMLPVASMSSGSPISPVAFPGSSTKPNSPDASYTLEVSSPRAGTAAAPAIAVPQGARSRGDREDHGAGLGGEESPRHPHRGW